VRVKNPLRKKPETLPVFIQPTGDDEVIAFGDAGALDLLGVVVRPIPESMVRTVRTALSATEDMAKIADQAKGVVLRLTPESQRMLKQYDALESGSAMLGVLQAPNGQIVHQLKFVKPAGLVATNLSGLVSGIAVQQQLAAIEKRLDQLQSSVDYLTDELHAEIEAELGSALHILNEIYSEVIQHDELSDDQWDRVANVEHEIKAHQQRTTLHMRKLQDALAEPEASLSQRVDHLSEAMQDQHLEAWLALHIEADHAITQWELLYTRRQFDKHPERVEALAVNMRLSIVERHDAMTNLVEGISEYLDAGGHTRGLLERSRIFKRAHLNRLLEDLDEMLRTYQAATTEADSELSHTHAPLAIEPADGSAWGILKSEVGSAPGVRRGAKMLNPRSLIAAPVKGAKATRKAISDRRKSEE
jgi:hypothetical protein